MSHSERTIRVDSTGCGVSCMVVISCVWRGPVEAQEAWQRARDESNLQKVVYLGL